MIDILSWFALILLTLAGYSAGAVLGSRAQKSRQNPSPSLLDTAIVVVLWITGITFRLIVLKPWVVVGVWLVVAIAVALVLNWVQPQSDEGKLLPQ